MNAATCTGRAMKAVWLPSISSTVAFMRVAMNRSASGEMALSRVGDLVPRGTCAPALGRQRFADRRGRERAL